MPGEEVHTAAIPSTALVIRGNTALTTRSSKISSKERKLILALHLLGPGGKRRAVEICIRLGVTKYYGAVLHWKRKNPPFKKREYGRMLKERRLAELAEERATRRAARIAEREAKIVAKAKATLARIEARKPYKSPKHTP